MKKITSILLLIVLVLSSTMFIYGEDDNYTYILQKTKAAFGVKDYENFTYNISSKSNKKIYSFSWDNGEDDRLKINVDEALCVYYYSINEANIENTNAIDRSKANIIADDFIKLAMGDKSSYFKFDESKTEEYAKTIEFTYVPYIDGYKVQSGGYYGNLNANIKVDLLSGRVTYFESQFGYCNLDSVDSSNFITKIDAKNALFTDDNLELSYINVYETDEDTVSKPLYRLKNAFVNAKTGKLLNDECTISEAFDTSSAVGGGYATTKDMGLTVVEKEEVENIKNALSIKEAVNILNNKFHLNIDTKDVTVSYYKTDDGYNSHFACEGVFSASFNPKKEIENFDYYKYEIAGKENIINFVRGIYPNTNIPKDLLDGDEILIWDYDDNNKKNYECYFYNKVDGIIDKNSYIRLVYDDKYNSKYGFYYQNNTVYHEKMARRLTKDEAYKIADDALGFNIVYVTDYDYNLTPYYTFSKLFSIDGVTQEVLDNRGYKFNDNFKAYTDVKGMWYENIANTLISYVYKFDTDKFDGDKNVTVADVKEFIYGDINIDGDDNREITKYEMAKILVERMGYSNIAKGDIFKTPFNDVNKENTGYVAICKVLGIAKGENGTFNGEKIITRAEMASMVYNFVLAKYDK